MIELSESSRALAEALEGIGEDEAAFRPDPLRWSVLDCVEHLALAEHGMLKRITSAPVAEPLTADSGRELRIATSMIDRSFPREAPGSVFPAGRFATLAEACERFDAARSQTILFAQEHAGDLVLRTIVHPFFGPVTGTEMMLIMAGHVRRHADQIREIRRSLLTGFATPRESPGPA
jgi:hypothetical protein